MRDRDTTYMYKPATAHLRGGKFLISATRAFTRTVSCATVRLIEYNGPPS
jgi:hypothetical protein